MCVGGREETLALFNGSDVSIPTPEHCINEHGCLGPLNLPGCCLGEALGTSPPLENYA